MTQAMVPLILDLDGTTVLTDTLVETALRVLAERPRAFAGAAIRAFASRAALKRAMAQAHPIDPQTLIYNQAVLELARRARAEGRRVYLVTAADRDVADRVALHLGVFDGVFASDGQTNLKAEAKAAFLADKFGANQFDYAGDADADRPVWRQARRAIVVNASPGLVRQVREECPDVEVIGAPRSARETLVLVSRALRLHQWAKNVLLLAPVLAAHRMGMGVLLQAVLGFVAFSCCASSVYLLNDLVDLPHDRAHATKRRRPFASGALDLTLAPGLIAGLLAAALGLSLFLPAGFFLMLAIYYLCTLSYSFVLKRLAVWDVIMLAALYTIRIFAGAAATLIPVSPWLLAFAMFLFLCLAIVKRLTELTAHVRGGADTKLKGRGYVPEDLDMLRSMAAASGYMSVLVLALYVNGGELAALYRHPQVLWGLCPALLFWISRVLMLANRGRMHDDPVVFALRDRTSQVAGLICLGLIVAATR
jgi:4-hydroxybenzoate polyprenyltransferase/phosphoserine phosphatase